jgi:hypothetical protein
MKKPLLSLVVPFYNEEETIDQFFPRVCEVLNAIETVDYEIVCVNDGSKDATLVKLVAAAKRNERIHVIDLSRNFGKEAALTAGLNEAAGDVIVPFDADLQDPRSDPPTCCEVAGRLRRCRSQTCRSRKRHISEAIFSGSVLSASQQTLGRQNP